MRDVKVPGVWARAGLASGSCSSAEHRDATDTASWPIFLAVEPEAQCPPKWGTVPFRCVLYFGLSEVRHLGRMSFVIRTLRPGSDILSAASIKVLAHAIIASLSSVIQIVMSSASSSLP